MKSLILIYFLLLSSLLLSCENSQNEKSFDSGESWIEVEPSVIWSPRAGMSAVVFKDKLWILGGFELTANGATPLNDVWSSDDGENWNLVTPNAAWTPRAGHCSVVFRDRIWVIAGNADTDYFNDVWSSDDGENWVEEKPLNENALWGSRTGISCFVTNNKIYLMGGADYNGLNEIWSSGDGKSWEQETAGIWPGRAYSAYVKHNEGLWIIGGNDYANAYYSDVWVSYDAGLSWEKVSEIETDKGIYGAKAISYDKKIWLIGGNGNMDEILTSIDGMKWEKRTTTSALPHRSYHVALEFHDHIWVMGGSFSENMGISLRNDIWHTTK